MNLYCAACDMPHDVDLAPDTGDCIACGGPLIEDETERASIGAGGRAIVDAVTDGLAAAAIIRGKAERGGN